MIMAGLQDRSFPVHSMGWIELEESQVASWNIRSTFAKCTSSLARQRKDLLNTADTWGEGKVIRLEIHLEGDTLKLVEPRTRVTLRIELVSIIRAWGVGKEDRRYFAYVAWDPATDKYKCHMFYCHGNMSGRVITDALNDMCNKIEKAQESARKISAQKPWSDITPPPSSARAFGSLPSPDVPGITLPSTTLEDKHCGTMHGIQGHDNSCYLDATLYSMFAFSMVFDTLLLRERKNTDLAEFDEVQRVLRESIVNPLRTFGFVRGDCVMKLRELLDKLSSTAGHLYKEKTPEEFLHSLLQEVWKADPFLHLKSQDAPKSDREGAFFYQIITEKDDTVKIAQVQQLLELSFFSEDIVLAEPPLCLILQMPRFGDKYNMYDMILPNLELDVTDIVGNIPRDCVMCGSEIAQFECRDCQNVILADGIRITRYCAGCNRKVHSHRDRVGHRRRPSVLTGQFYSSKQIPDQHKMELFAVVCIETSHYVAFVKCGVGADAPWCFFDSMADMKGEKNDYNIPAVSYCPEALEWLSKDPWEIIAAKERGEMPEKVRRLLGDGYLCMYQDLDMIMYKFCPEALEWFFKDPWEIIAAKERGEMPEKVRRLLDDGYLWMYHGLDLETLASHSEEKQQEQLREKGEREANLIRQLRQTEEERGNIQRELGKWQEQLRERDLREADLFEQLREKEQQQENSQRRMTEMEEQLANCQEQLRERDCREVWLREQLTEKERQQENSKRQVTEMEQQLTEKNEERGNLVRQLNEVQQQLREMAQQVTNCQEQLVEKHLREASLHEQLRERERQQENSQRERLEMEERLTICQEQLQEQGLRKTSLHEQLREKEQQQETSQRERAEIEEQLTNCQGQIREKNEEMANIQQRVSTLERQLRVKEQELNELELSLTTAQQTLRQQRQQETCDWVISRHEIQVTDKCLGRGGWGSVNEGTYCGCSIAVKQIHELILSRHNRRLFEREMNIASRCRHPCLLQFIGATNDEGSPLFVTELMETSLRALLEQRELSETEITVISLDVARALNYLHQKKPSPIIHRDVSSANVLLWRQGDQWRGKVSDYGTANFIQQSMTVAPGAPIYCAPEALSSSQTAMVDVYSFGVLLCEMCIGEMPDPERREEQLLMVTNRVIRGLVRRCLKTEPAQRPNMEEIVQELEQFTET